MKNIKWRPHLLRARTLGLIAGRLDYLIGVETFRQIVHLPPQMTERSTVSKQLATLKQFDSIRDFFTGNAAGLALETPFVVLFVSVIWVLGGPIAIVPIVMIGLYLLFAAVWLPTMNRHVAKAGATRTAYQHMLMETFSGLREIKALSVEGVWRSRLRVASADVLTALCKTAFGQAVLENVAYTVTTLAGVLVLALGTMRAMDGEMSIGALIAVMALLWRVLGPIQGLFLTYVKFDHVLLGVRTLNQLMRVEPERTSGKSALLSPRIKGALRFDRLSFRYAPGSDPALVGASFAIEPGEFFAILGQNGGGKSTVLKILAGMYTAQSGNAYIDDIDTRQFNPMDLRRLVAYVPQRPTLFHGTIAQNLRLKDVMASDQELESAARDAGVLEMIRELPDGFDTRIGGKDTDRSPSGLVHGLCLARAFLSQAPVVLLDEPGAALDYEGDMKLMEQLRRLKGRQTVVMVSHRPSHIKLADEAVIIHRGMVKFVGLPEEALAIVWQKAE